MKTIVVRIVRIFFRGFARIIQRFRILYYYCISSGDVHLTGKPVRNQPLYVTGGGRIAFCGTVRIGYNPSPGYFNTYAHFDLRGQNALIEIGEDTIINNNPSLIADGAKIHIGKICLIGLNFSVYTSDFHNLDPEKRLSAERIKMDVVVNDNVFVGNNVTILKGVTIGKNSVIGCGSIVVQNIPENVIAAGIPCKVIRSLG